MGTLKTDLFGLTIKSRYPDCVAEYKFCPVRKFRADWYIPRFNVLIEYEGVHSYKSRHTTDRGYTQDAEKYNIANLMGFRVLRYTYLNKNQIWRDLEALEKGFNPVLFLTKEQVLKNMIKKAVVNERKRKKMSSL